MIWDLHFNQPTSKKIECHVHQVGFYRKPPPPTPQLRQQKKTTTREKKNKAHIEETSPSELCKKVRSVEDFQLISSGTYIHINHPHPDKVKLETAGKAKIGGLFKPHLPI